MICTDLRCLMSCHTATPHEFSIDNCATLSLMCFNRAPWSATFSHRPKHVASGLISGWQPKTLRVFLDWAPPPKKIGRSSLPWAKDPKVSRNPKDPKDHITRCPSDTMDRWSNPLGHSYTHHGTNDNAQDAVMDGKDKLRANSLTMRAG